MKHRSDLRIIGGKWRGRRLPIATAPGLRPSKDAIRETLFNWLQNKITQKNCLDAFAGTGALGLEAASHGAKNVTLLEKSASLCEQLKQQVARLQADTVEIIHTDAIRYLQQPARQVYDIVMLDPPFASGLLEPAIAALKQYNWLGQNSYIYVENARQQGWPQLPDNWQWYRQKTMGNVCYGLIKT